MLRRGVYQGTLDDIPADGGDALLLKALHGAPQRRIDSLTEDTQCGDGDHGDECDDQCVLDDALRAVVFEKP